MIKPHKPENEAERLASLKELAILDTPAEERFDRITRLARKSLNSKIAIISLVDSERQWFKSVQGLSATETSRDVSFCGHAILNDDAFIITDATRDERFADNPLVTGELGIRLYAGQPVHSPTGSRIGTLCVIDSEPRTFSAEETLLLKDLAILVEREVKVEELNKSEIALRRQLTDAERRASIDALTRTWNRATIMMLLSQEIARAARTKGNIAVAMVDIDHFKGINDTRGHTVGDEVLAAVAERIRGAVRPYDSVGRYGGEEFMAIFAAADRHTAAAVGERIRQCVSYAAIAHSAGRLEVTTSVGVCSLPADDVTEGKTLVEAADRALYAAKRSGRDKVMVCNGEDSFAGV